MFRNSIGGDDCTMIISWLRLEMLLLLHFGWDYASRMDLG